jgi:2,3-dihydroxyphenylpropionate 1,2-dioxygenase
VEGPAVIDRRCKGTIMATVVFCGAISHSPMMNYPIDRDHDRVDRFRKAAAEMSRRIQDAGTEAIVMFGPDHFRTLFYDLMPSFVIGVGDVSGWGDWNTPAGPFETHPALAAHILQTTREAGFDAALSQEIRVDHGITQPLQLMELTDIPVVPILVNAAAPPLPLPSRCHAFGIAVGRAITSFPKDVRIAILASGGLSHDPPAPSRENALHGRSNGFASSREREYRLINNVDTLKARINTEWDRRVLDQFARGKAASLAQELTTEGIFDAAGNGGQEVRTWIAAAATIGDQPMEILFYEPIDVLVTGMGVIVK